MLGLGQEMNRSVTPSVVSRLTATENHISSCAQGSMNQGRPLSIGHLVKALVDTLRGPPSDGTPFYLLASEGSSTTLLERNSTLTLCHVTHWKSDFHQINKTEQDIDEGTISCSVCFGDCACGGGCGGRGKIRKLLWSILL